MNNPERIYISIASLPQALKDGVGSYYPNFTGDATQFDLAAYVPESKIKEEREAAFLEAKAAMREPSAGTLASVEFHRGFESMRRLAVRAIEAAASTKGENDGRRATD